MKTGKIYIDENNRELVEDVEGYRAFKEKYGLPAEQYLSTLSLKTLLSIMRELGVELIGVSDAELLESYQYQSVVETIDGEIFENVSLLDKAIEKVRETEGLQPSFFKESVIDRLVQLPVLTHGDTSLKPLSYENLESLESMRRSSLYTQFVNRGTLTTMTHTAFIAELQWQFLTSRDIQMVIYDKDVPIGTIFSYDYSPVDSRALLSIFLVEDAPVGLGVITMAMFAKFILEDRDINMLSVEVYDSNETVVKMLQKVGAEQTGYIKEWRKQDGGTYVGLYRFTFYKTQIEDFVGKYL